MELAPNDSGDYETEDFKKVEDVIEHTLTRKSALIDGNAGAELVEWVMGDIFHSAPVLIGSPKNTRYYQQNLPGYRDFFARNRFRRRVVLVGANDGQLHAFDAGTLDDKLGRHGDGTGKELFSFVPRGVLPNLRDQQDISVRRPWTVDATVQVADVYIDPLKGGNGRKGWRTIALGIVTAVGSTAGALLEWAQTVDWERYFKDGDLWWVPVGLGTLIIIYRIGTGTAVGER